MIYKYYTMTKPELVTQFVKQDKFLTVKLF